MLAKGWFEYKSIQQTILATTNKNFLVIVKVKTKSKMVDKENVNIH